METLRRLGLAAPVKRRYVELRAPAAEWVPAQRLAKRRRAWAEELVGAVGAVTTDDLPKPDELVHCAERIASGQPVDVPCDNIETRRADAHRALELAGAALLPHDPVTVALAHVAIDDTLDLIGNLRKPAVIALTCLMLALHRTSVEELRAGVGPLAGAPGVAWAAVAI